jgi:hypothetical protein
MYRAPHLVGPNEARVVLEAEVGTGAPPRSFIRGILQQKNGWQIKLPAGYAF